MSRFFSEPGALDAREVGWKFLPDPARLKVLRDDFKLLKLQILMAVLD